MAFAFAAPILLLFHYKRKGAQVLPFFVGCGVFVLFVAAEGAVNNLLFVRLPLGEKLRASAPLYALAGGLMAGLFEETGRFAAFRTVLNKRLGNDRNALMYGAGHGGVEAMLLLGLAYLSNLIMAAMLNVGLGDKLTAGLTGTAAEQVQAALTNLATAAPWTYLLGMLERAVAMTTHICLSVLVWFAAKKPGKGWLYPLAILIHAALDGVTVLLAGALPVAAVEGCLALMAVPLALLARRVWRNNAEV